MAKQHKKPNQISKLVIGTAIVALLMLVGSTFGNSLTGRVVQTSCANCDNLTLELVNLDSIPVNGNQVFHSFSALKLTSAKPDAFRFGSDYKSTIWVILKNRSRDGFIYNGQVVYQNSSSVWKTVPTTIRAEGSDSRNVIVYLPPYFGGTPTQPKITFTTRQSGSQALNEFIRGRATQLRVEIPERTGTAAYPQGKWITYATFGAGTSTGTPTATEAGFRDSPSLTTAGKVNYEYAGDAPYCSTRGSCVETAPTTTLVQIKYATSLPS